MSWRKPMDWGYVSGFFDGEGTIDIGEGLQANGIGIRRKFRLAWYQNSREVLDEIGLFLKSQGIESIVREHTRPDRIALGHAGSFQLVVTGFLNCWKVLSSMDGYLIVKEEKMNWSLEWMYSLMESAESGEFDGQNGPARKTYSSLRAVI